MGIIDNEYYRLVLPLVSSVCVCKLFCEYIGYGTTTAGPSMYPTLPTTEGTAIVWSPNRLGRGLKIGDMVVAKHPFFNSGIGKRILGMPGDYVIVDAPASEGANVGPSESMMVQVPEGHCWLGGDNLPWSRDSREYGPVPLGLVQGRVLWLIQWRFPWPKYTKLTNTLEPVEWEDEEIPHDVTLQPQPSGKDNSNREMQEKS